MAGRAALIGLLDGDVQPGVEDDIARGGEPAQEPPNARAIRRRHTRPRHLTVLGIVPLSRDLRTMLIETHHDSHPPPLPFTASLISGTRRALTRAASSPTHRIPWITVGTSSSMAGRAAAIRARLA